jgi:hypothetical protein
VLPAGFVRIRHYGFLANRVCREKLALCRALLEVATTPEPAASEPSFEAKETVEERTAVAACPCCGVGRMVIIATLPAIPVNRRARGSLPEPVGCDTS